MAKKVMTASVIYNGELRTACTHLKSNSAVETDAPVDNNGLGERFSPTDLLATSLAACMLTIMGIKAKGMGFDLNNMKMDVLKIMKSDPRRVGGIDLAVTIPQELEGIDEKTKTILKNAANACPVMKSIHPDIEVNVNWGSWEN